MRTRGMSYFVRAFGVLLLVAAAAAALTVGPLAHQAAVDAQDNALAGVVTGPNGPEAGVWVIAETTDLPTRFVRIVVTDDQGRYVMPDLPNAGYQVWVRGYGLVDSPKVAGTPGRTLDLTAVLAPNPAAAAEYYPAGYWYSLLHVPDASEFPGTADNGINVDTQAQWLRGIKSTSCMGCHALGNKATRTISDALGHFDSSVDAWDRRIRSGQAGAQMLGGLNLLGRQRALEMFADWTDRIAAGALPPIPPRPQGVERNVVITQWDWAEPTGYLHDEVSTDKRDPTVNAYGRIYGSMELSKDYSPVLDPIANTASRVPLAPRDPNTPPAQGPNMLAPSQYWGDEAIWTSRVNVHNPMFDETGRVWLTTTIRPPENPDFCREGSSLPSAQQFPLDRAARHLAVYDPVSEQLTHIDTCFSTHHLVFAEDANRTLWTSGGGGGEGGGPGVVGWLNTRLFDATGDAQAAQGWTPLILDTNGNGKRDAYVEPDEAVDPTLDKRLGVTFYAVAVAPDGIVWGSDFTFPGGLVRLDPGSNPPETAMAEYYQPPWNNPDVPTVGYGPRGMDVDRNGVVWTPMASGHLASFDRRKCQGPLNGPTATGQHCPEGWTFYQEPIPQFDRLNTPGSAESSYYTWVDQFDTLGLGPNTPINTGNGDEGPLALVNGQWVVLRVPYPLGFYAKGLDGRIDDPSAGWKGRGLWATVGSRAPFHMETGKGTTPKVLHFQIRPDPLAR
jgi:hypothetical protein